MNENKLRARFDAEQPSIGTRILAPWPGLIEVLGGTDTFDYVQFLAEYAPYDLHDLENLARAAELHDLSTMVKVDGANRTNIAQRCLAAGFENFLFSDIRSVEDAREAVRAVRAEPDGEAGIRMDRRIGYVGAYEDMRTVHEDVVERSENAVVALMIEKTGAIEDLDAILAVDGVDAITFGPSDYSLSVGRPGAIDDPVVTEAEAAAFETATATGVEPIVELSAAAECEPYRDTYGISHFNLGVDVSVLDSWWRTEGGELRDRIDHDSESVTGT